MIILQTKRLWNGRVWSGVLQWMVQEYNDDYADTCCCKDRSRSSNRISTMVVGLPIQNNRCCKVAFCGIRCFVLEILHQHVSDTFLVGH